MPLNFKILEAVGTTNERLREVLTAVRKETPQTPEVDKKNLEDVDIRRRIEEMTTSRVTEAIGYSIENHHLFSAADLAWDASPINGTTVPLIMYSQGRIRMEECADSLKAMGWESMVEKDAADKVVALKRPKFVPSEVNLVRSIVSRRVAAQCNRYNSLWPFFKYESRSTAPAAKLRADAMSQVADITADLFDYRHIQEQVIRDILLYQQSTIFPACQWQRDMEWVARENASEFVGEDGKVKEDWDSVVKREGVPWIVAHPGRTFFDSSFPPSTINSDTGCSWFGYWDVSRWGSIKNNTAFFNLDAIGYNSVHSQFQLKNPFFQQYFSTVLSPVEAGKSIAQKNDSKSTIGLYSGLVDDAAVFVTHLMWKMKPVEWGIGRYPYPIWVHLTVSGDTGTVVHAEIMPDVPGVHFAYNGSDHRRRNLSMAADLFAAQDQMNNLMGQLIEEIRRDLLTVFVLNTEVWDTSEEAKANKEQFIKQLRDGQFFEDPLILTAQFSQLKQMLGADAFSPDNIFKVIRTTPNTKIEELYKAMAQVMLMADRTVAMSPQEQGQMSPRETSATESQIVATTTESVFAFVSDAIDAGRAAWKRYLYNAFVSCSKDDITIPVVERYSATVAEQAGLTVIADTAGDMPPGAPRFMSVTGKKKALVCELIFSTRDGADRSSNVQAAQALTQLLQIVLSTPAAGAITKDQLALIVNEIARLGGSGFDLGLKFPEGEGSMPVAPSAPPPSPTPGMQPTAGLSEVPPPTRQN